MVNKNVFIMYRLGDQALIKGCIRRYQMRVFYLKVFYFHSLIEPVVASDFIWDFRVLPFPSHLEKYFIKIGNTGNWENKGHFLIGNDSHIRP